MNALQKLDSSNPVPLYFQLVQIIKGLIESGELRPGDVFWTEEEIQKMCDISRTTVRAAIHQLAREGFLAVRQGKRTCVSRPKVIRGFPGLTSFTEDMRKRGLKPGSRLIAFKVFSPEPEINARLGLDEGQEIVQLKRQMLANGEPIGYHIVHLPHEAWTKLDIEPSFLSNRSLYQTLEERGGFDLAEAEESIEVGYADREVAKMLLLKKGEPILIMNRLVFSSAGVPIEYAVNIYRADRYKYEIHHKRRKEP